MRAVMSKAIFKTMISHASIIFVDDLPIQFTNSGWRICGLDVTKSAFLEVKMGSDIMESYEFPPYDESQGEKPHAAILPIGKLDEAMAVIPDDSVLTVTDDGSTFRIDAGKYHIRVRENGTYHEVDVPRVSSNCIFGINTADFNKMLVSARSIRDTIVFHCGQDGFRLSVLDETDTEGMEYNDPEITYEKDFSTRYMLDFVVNAFRGMRGNVLLELDEGYPLKITSKDPFATTFLLAPIMISESEE